MLEIRNLGIKSEFSNEEIKIALEGDLKKKWALFRRIEGNDEFSDLKFRVRFGKNNEFDIYSIIEGDFEKKPAFGIIQIERKNKMNITDFRTELEEREKIMDNVIGSLYNDDFDSQKETEIDGYE